MKSLIALLLMFSIPSIARAWECIDCRARFCSERCVPLLGCPTVCTPGAYDACVAANLGCGRVEVPAPGPVQPNNPVQIPIPKDAQTVLTTLATGGMLNPATKQVADNAIKALDKAIKDIGQNLSKAGNDANAEMKRAERDIDDAGHAIAGYVEMQAKGTADSAQRALDRVREGKAIDALWHAAIDPWKTTSDASAYAATKSEIINTVGTLAASTYGGPGGAAAYAAWLTYYQSGGDVNLALKVGALAGATAWAMAETGKMPTRDAAGNIAASDVAKKTVVTGAIGGLAVAAAGGDENAVRDAFVRGGGMVLIQEGYSEVTKHNLDRESFKESKGDPYCVSTVVDCRNVPKDAIKRDPKTGKFIGLDQSKLDKTAPHVGMGWEPTNKVDAPIKLVEEASPFMKGVSKIPGTNAMAVFHDQWAMNWQMPQGVLQATIVPAVVLTYNGSTAPLLEKVRTVAKNKAAAMKSDELNSPRAPVVFRDAVISVPIKENQVATAYTCAKAGDSRSLIVEVDEKKTEFACRAVYRSNQERKIVWSARNDTQYCGTAVKPLVKSQLDWGYRCVVAARSKQKANNS